MIVGLICTFSSRAFFFFFSKRRRHNTPLHVMTDVTPILWQRSGGFRRHLRGNRIEKMNFTVPINLHCARVLRVPMSSRWVSCIAEARPALPGRCRGGCYENTLRWMEFIHTRWFTLVWSLACPSPRRLRSFESKFLRTRTPAGSSPPSGEELMQRKKKTHWDQSR